MHYFRKKKPQWRVLNPMYVTRKIYDLASLRSASYATRNLHQSERFTSLCSALYSTRNHYQSGILENSAKPVSIYIYIYIKRVRCPSSTYHSWAPVSGWPMFVSWVKWTHAKNYEPWKAELSPVDPRVSRSVALTQPAPLFYTSVVDLVSSVNWTDLFFSVQFSPDPSELRAHLVKGTRYTYAR